MGKQKTLFKGPLAKLEDLAEKFLGFKKKVEDTQDEKNKVEEEMISEMREKGITSFPVSIDGQRQTFKLKHLSARDKIKVEV